ncbi:unnamed protein product [Eruca vesicaria subsp. sativa]|uniref:Uncharacterized protein n=1 Tax=Eruca vesicaria subsp. sativa TaxID=29727 RepID=A0ABC8J336_ERUVS|nr:unnamed protein product [Eruca vesicaria subsp. sativa]
MENSVNNSVKRVRMIHEDENQKEESSWIVYFEDIDHEEGREETIHYYDSDSSMISDAASPVHTTKITNVIRRKDNSINTNHKKRRIVHQHQEEEKREEEEEDEDTASSPSNKTKGFCVLDGAEYNAKHGKYMDNVTSEERGCLTDTGSKINEEFFSAELKKRGLCVVPLSVLSNFIA